MDTVIQFGEFEVRPDRREIRCDSRTVELGGRAFDMLLVFIAQRGRLLTKSALLELVWPDTVVDDSNVYAQISAVRAALGSGVVATIPGRGYRFVAPVTSKADLELASPATLVPSLPGSAAPAFNQAPLIGRTRELAVLTEMLSQHRLVTVTGPGGAGKSSLVKAYLNSLGPHAQERWAYADLSGTTDPDVVPYLVAQSLRLPISVMQTAVPALIAALSHMTRLLVLDSAEHLLGAVGSLVDAILEQAPGISICVTSVVPLRRQGERVLRIQGLELPDPDSTAPDMARNAAVALFAEEARAVHHSFELSPHNQHQVAEICRQLDGMPLAIKLAASRIPTFGVSGLLQRITERLRLLVNSGPETGGRHQSLRATLDWTHGLLSPEQQQVFHRLSVFSPSFTLPLAVAVSRDVGLSDWEIEDIVAVLVDHSLVMADGADLPRYRLLVITQDYAREKLAKAGLLDRTMLAHATVMADILAESHAENLWTWPENEWLEHYSTELSNMRAAIRWSMVNAPEMAVPMVTAWSRLFGPYNYGLEAMRYNALVEPLVTSALPPKVQACYWFERAARLMRTDDRQCLPYVDKAVELARQVDDKTCLYQALGWAAVCVVQPRDRAHAHLDEMAALEQPDWPPKLRHLRQFAASMVFDREGLTHEALAASRASFELAREGQSPSRLWLSLFHQASLLVSLGEFRAAVDVARPGVDQLKNDYSVIGLVLKVVHACALVMTNELEDARSRFLDVLQGFRNYQWYWFGLSSVCLALLAAREQRFKSAALILGFTGDYTARVGGRDAGGRRVYDLTLTMVQQQLVPEDFARLFAEGARLSEEQVCALALSKTDDVALVTQVPMEAPVLHRA